MFLGRIHFFFNFLNDFTYLISRYSNYNNQTMTNKLIIFFWPIYLLYDCIVYDSSRQNISKILCFSVEQRKYQVTSYFKNDCCTL